MTSYKRMPVGTLSRSLAPWDIFVLYRLNRQRPVNLCTEISVL